MSGVTVPIPVIAIDGPSASGKGTVAARVAAQLGYHLLDSGALYRLVALSARESDVSWADEAALVRIAAELPVRFAGEQILLSGKDVALDIRSEEISAGASKVAALPALREALVGRQRAFRQSPGLVADGRDMGSAIFPDAMLKVFLTASVEVRAQRRYKQLIEKGLSANIRALLQELEERDARDAARPVAPLRKYDDALLLDTTTVSVDEAVGQVLAWALSRLPGAGEDPGGR